MRVVRVVHVDGDWCEPGVTGDEEGEGSGWEERGGGSGRKRGALGLQ